MTPEKPEASEEQQRKSWVPNAGAWTAAVRGGQIESRAQGTDAAILEAVARCGAHRVLDVGCGEGRLAHTLAERGCEVVGVDGSARLIAAACEEAGRFLHLSYADLVAAPQRLGADFDAAVCNFSLLDEEVVPLLNALRGRLRPQGHLLIQTVHPFGKGSEPYEDGWRTETFAGFGDTFAEPMPWYFRTFSSWIEVVHRSGYAVEHCVEPVPEQGGSPLSLLVGCTKAARSSSRS
jgi:2-polyprenyl-3-methyl-5-hydroxy-6-metoxy-1,4-benzoquinol methylase